MKRLIVLMSATFLMGSSAIWAQSSGSQSQTDQSTSSSQTDQSTSSSSSSTQSTDQNANSDSSQSGKHAKGMTQTWTGTLVDASCHDATPTATCTPTSSTSHFGLMTADGQYYKLDKKSTSKAQSAIQSNASSANASASAGSPTVTVTGKLEGKDSIRADSITVGSSSSMGAMNTSSPCISSSSNASQNYPSSTTSSSSSATNPSGNCDKASQSSSTQSSSTESSQSNTSQPSSTQSSSTDSSQSNASQPSSTQSSSTESSQSNASQSSSSDQTAPSSAAGDAAATYTGTLYDVACHEQTPNGACPYTSTTATVGVMTSDGHFYKLDSSSLTKVQDAMRARTNMTGQEKVSIKGTLQGDTLTVDSINIQ